MASNLWRITPLLEKEFEKAARKFTKEIGKEIEQAYEDTWKAFISNWNSWRKTAKNSSGTLGKNERDINGIQKDANGSHFMLEASSAYDGDINFSQQLGSNPLFNSGIDIDPENSPRTLHSQWGEKRGDEYSKEDAFEAEFEQGVMGYSRRMVDKTWYRSEESQKKYYRRYHLKGIENPKRSKILKMIYQADIIPPVAKIKPAKDMERRFKKITTKKHLNEKWKEIVGDLDKEIEKLIKN